MTIASADVVDARYWLREDVPVRGISPEWGGGIESLPPFCRGPARPRVPFPFPSSDYITLSTCNHAGQAGDAPHWPAAG